MATLATLNVELMASSARFKANMEQAGKALNDFSSKTKRMAQGVNSTFKKIEGAVFSLQGVFAGLAIAGVAGLVKQADAYNQLQAKVKGVLPDVRQFDAAMKSITDSANRSGISVDAAAGSFLRIGNAVLRFGYTADEVVRFNETFSKIGALAGASGQEVEMTLYQVSQALSSGVLQGEELKSVLEQMPAAADAIAEAYSKKFGGSVESVRANLKQLAKDGAITTTLVMDAIIAKSQEADAAFAKLPPSVDRSMALMGNAFTELIGNLNSLLGVTNAVAGGFEVITAIIAGVASGFDGAAESATGSGEAAKSARENWLQMLQGIQVATAKTVAVFKGVVAAFGGVGVGVVKVMIDIVNAGLKAIQQLIQKSMDLMTAAARFMGQKVGTFKAPAMNIDGAKSFIDKSYDRLSKYYMSARSDFMSKTGGIDFSAGGKMKTGIHRTPSTGEDGDGKKKKGKKGKKAPDADMLDKKLGSSVLSAVEKGTKSFFDLMEKSRDEMDKLKVEVESSRGAMIDWGNSLREATETPLQNYNAQLDALKYALQNGVIDQETFNKSVDRLKNEVIPGAVVKLDEYKKGKAELDEVLKAGLITQEQYNAGMNELKGNIYPELITKTDEYKQKVSELQALYSSGLIGQTEFNNGMKVLADQLKDDGIKGAIEELQTVAQNFGKSFEDAFVNAAMTGKFAFKDLMASILEDLARATLRMAVINPIMNGLFGKGTAGDGGGIVGSILGKIGGSLFGKRAAGGPVMGDRPYLVGERGPEIFTPHGAGSVTPNNAIGGGGGGSQPVMVTQHFNFTGDVTSQTRAEVARMAPKIMEDTKKALYQEIRTGGTMSKLVGRRA